MPKCIKYKGQIYEAVLDESKADEEKFRAWAGNSVADVFYKLKPRVKAPENDIYY